MLESQSRNVLIAVNPKSGRGSGVGRVDALAGELAERGFSVRCTSDLDELTTLAAQLHDTGELRLVITAGGDGTLAEVVNRLAPEVIVAPFPLGTANLMAKFLGHSNHPVDMAEAIRQCRTIRLDAGRANGRLFLIMIGCGFDGEVVHRLHAVRAGHIRYWSYLKPIWNAIRSYQYPRLRVYCDPPANGSVQPLLASFAFVSNLPTYGGGFQFSAAADPADGKLDVCALEGGSLWRGLWYAGLARLRRLHSSKGCRQALGARLRIESDGPARYQLDGDPGGLLPLDVEVLPARVILLTPPDRSKKDEPRAQ